MFSHDLPAAIRFAEFLCTAGVERGLLGPREPERIWTRHLMSSAALAELVAEEAEVTDLGSGAGLPGIPMVLARPDLRMTLVEPMMRRIAFLEEAVALLGLPITVRRARAQELAPAGCEVVVARALAPLRELVDMAIPLLRPGGELLAVKGERAEVELAEAADALRDWPAARVSLDSCGEGEHTVRVVRIVLPLDDQGAQ